MHALALVLADSRTPTGSYAHSAGLEAAVAGGLRPSEVPAFLAGRAETVASTEAALSAAACLAAADPALRDRVGPPTPDALLALDREAVARCPSPALRTAASTLGRSLLRTGAQLFPDDAVLPEYRRASSATPRPIALGVVAAAAGLTPGDAALIALHDDAASVAAAAVKLLPVDAGAASAWVAAGAADRERLARAAVEAALDGRLPSLGAPLIELRSISHSTDRGRLFAS